MSEEFRLTGRVVQPPSISVSGPVHAKDDSKIHIGHNFTIEKDRCLEHLRSSDPRLDKERIQNTAGGLFKNSYMWIFSNSDYKQLQTDDGKRLLWITGDPGKGKTMLLCGIIDELKASATHSNVVFFFCQATDARINTATSVLRGLIFLLVVGQPSLLSHVKKKYDDAGKPLFEDPNAWNALLEIFESIIQDPDLRTTFLIIDALDECTAEDLAKLLDFISKNTSFPYLKWIVSSRNNIKIENGLELDQSRTRLSLEQNSELVSRAVEAYIDDSVSKSLPIREDMTLYETIGAAIKRKAKGTFLWASLVIRELKEANEWDMEEIIENTPESLTDMYDQMFHQITQLKLTNPKYCRLTLAAVITARRPLKIEELGPIAGLPNKIRDRPPYVISIVKQCGSFLTVQDHTVYFIHQSAKDFLSKAMFGSDHGDRKNQPENVLTIPRDIKSQEHAMFSRSLQILSSKLKRDMYNLNTPGYSIENVPQPEPDPLASDPISKLVDFLSDARLFLQYNKSAIEGSPLQVYTSALVFSPTQSLIRGIFKELEPEWITLKPDVQDSWSSCIQSFEDHTGQVNAVTFSRDGQWLASGSDDFTAKIWDSSTGTCLKTLKGHSKKVTSVAFSPNGCFIASASFDRTIKLWDVASGDCLQTLEGHWLPVLSVTFSNNGILVASGSSDQTLRVWNLDSGVCIAKLDDVSSRNGLHSVAFSPDDMSLISGHTNHIVRAWSIAKARETREFIGHSRAVFSVSYSPRGQLIASGSADGTIRLWNPATGECTRVLRGHQTAVAGISFSPDGRFLASGSGDETVKLWNVDTGSCLNTYKDHTDNVYSVSFSPDGSLIASASGDCMVKLWSVTNVASSPLPSDHDGSNVKCVALSSDGRFIVSTSNEKMLKLWDSDTGKCLRTFGGHKAAVLSVTFAPDSRLIASASADRTIKLWDRSTGDCIETFMGHIEVVHSVIFSPNGRFIASASTDLTVKIWDTTTDDEPEIITNPKSNKTLLGNISLYSPISFSSDGLVIACACDDKTIMLSDTTTFECIGRLVGNEVDADATSITFSNNDDFIMSAHRDGEIKVWNRATMTCTQAWQGCKGFSTLAFNSDEQYIHTELGRFLLHKSPSIESIPGSSQILPSEGYGIAIDGTHITWNSNRLLWLPPEYRPASSAVAGSKLVIGCVSGRILIVQFSSLGISVQ